MIGLLNGVVVWKDVASMIIDVHGVGYKTAVPVSILSQTAIGDTITVFTHTHVREDLLELYGFVHHADLKLFEYLIGVSGVGCKTALGVFSVGSRNEIVHAITNGDVGFFTAVPRLGKKNGQKIIIELKNKLGGEADLDLGAADDSMDEVLAALKSLGFNPTEARHALKSLNGQGETVGEKVRFALKHLGK